jgi:hypothetical protein
MRTVVIYPGRFHPFHRGHKASYDYLVKKYGDQNVFVVSSNKQDPETSPFSFDDKMSMMTKLGISPGQIAHVANPYQAREITSQIDDKDNTVLIFAVSEKDMAGPDARFDFKPKKDGSASYIQPVPESGRLEPMTKHAYVAVTPTVNFKVRGADANSASQIRKKYIDGNDADRDQIIADLYGDVDAGIRDIFDLKLGTGRPVEMVKESRERIAKKINLLRERIAQLKEFAPSSERDDNDDIPDQLLILANRWWNAADRQPQIESVLNSMGWSIHQVESEDDAVQLQHRDGTVYFISADDFDPDVFEESADYIEEKWSQKYKSSINCSNPKGFSQRAHCAGRKK